MLLDILATADKSCSSDAAPSQASWQTSTRKIFVGGWSMLLLTLILALSGCTTPTGDVRFIVTYSDGGPARDVTVNLSGRGPGGETDASGELILRDVDVNIYNVVVTHLGGVTEARSVEVLEGQLTVHTIFLPFDPKSLIRPQLSLLTPTASDTIYATVPFEVELLLTGEGQHISQAQVEFWIPATNYSGSLQELNGRWGFSGYLDEPGSFDIIITARTTFPEPVVLRFVVEVQPLPAMQLTLDSTHANGIKLSWTKYYGTRPFRVYSVKRAIFGCSEPTSQYTWETIATITDLNELTFVDTLPPPLSKQVCYQVSSLIDFQDSAVTPIRSYRPKGIHWADMPIAQLLAHPTNPDIAYAREQNGARIAVYNIRTNAREALVELSGQLGPLVIGTAGEGLELFVPSSNGNVYVLDPINLSQKARINTIQGCKAVVPFEDGFLLISDDHLQGNISTYRTYARADGRLLKQSQTRRTPAHFLRVPGANAAIAIPDNYSTTSYYLTFSSSGDILEETSHRNNEGNPFSGFSLAMSPLGDFWLSGGAANLYTVAPIPRFLGRLDYPQNLNPVAFTISHNGKEIYTATEYDDPSTSDPSLGHILVNDYPSRLRKRAIALRGRALTLAVMADGRILTTQQHLGTWYSLTTVLPTALIVVEP